MRRLHGGMPAAAALMAIAFFAGSAAEAKVKAKHHHAAAPEFGSAYRRPEAFPVYVDRGSDRNPGGDNLYFTDTKDPHYVVGPAWFQRWEDR
jgi:hypothetical protein